MKNVPNILSALRILLAPLFIVLYLQDEILYRSLSIAVFAIAAVTDYFDGYIAREFNAGSKLGNFLDPLADKILTISGFIVLPFIAPTIFPIIPIILIIIRDIGITFLRLFAERRQITVQTRKSAKFKTVVQMIFLYLALLAGLFIQADVFPGDVTRLIFESGVFTWSLYFVAFITVYTGIEYIVINYRLFNAKYVTKV